MDEATASAMRDVRALVDEYRLRCFWYSRVDYYPDSPDAAVRALEAIQRYGDLAGFKKAGALRQWLSRTSNARSAG